MPGDSNYPPPSRRWAATPLSGLLAALAVVATASGVEAGSRPVEPSPPFGTSAFSQLRASDPASSASDADELLDESSDADRGDVAAGAEQVFGSDLVSVRGVTSFSRGPDVSGPTDLTGLAPLLNPTRLAPKGSGPASLTGADLSETIFALRSDSVASRSEAGERVGSVLDGASDAGRAPRRALLMFWEDAEGTNADFILTDSADAAAATSGTRGDVFIPLPAAAWSALSVMGGVSLMAGLRRVRQRLR